MTRNNKFLAVGVIALAFLVVLNLLFAPKKDDNIWISTAKASDHQMTSVEVIGAPAVSGAIPEPTLIPTATPVAPTAAPETASTGPGKPVFPAIWQRDKAQYNSDAEWQTWSPSACSAAALSSVLIGYGHPVRITDVLYQFQQEKAIKSSVGLFKYDVFNNVASQFGLKVVYSEDKDLNAHFGRVLDYLKQGYPVILNVLDPVYFPDGHFIVATGFNSDGTVAIMNPDPTGGSQVNQNWTQDSLKLYFSRMKRSAAVLP